jgi:hypothetical protein
MQTQQKNAVFIIVVFVLVFLFFHRVFKLGFFFRKNIQEGFSWNEHLTQQFLEIQNTQNPGIVFDPAEIQRQASEQELKYFLKHKKWPWSENTKELYTEALNRNPFVRTSPQTAIDVVQSIYNEQAILQLLSWQAKEGQFLLHGVTVEGNKKKKGDKDDEYELLPNGWGEFAYNSGQINRSDSSPLYKCAYDKEGNLSITKFSYDFLRGIRLKVPKAIPNSKLESTIPGFQFIRRDAPPCNPCDALDNPPGYTCPFTIKTKGTFGGTSPIWKYLWGI